VHPAAEIANASAIQIQTVFRPFFVAIIVSPSGRPCGMSVVNGFWGWNCAGVPEMILGLLWVQPVQKSTPILTGYADG
jgi:hypothetical protein